LYKDYGRIYLYNMAKYQCGKIYIVYNDIDTEFYIGSTCAELDSRWHRHILGYYSFTYDGIGGLKLYKHMHKVPNFNRWHIHLFEAYPCNSKSELLNREGFWIKRLKPTLNINVPSGKYYKDRPKRISDSIAEQLEYDKEMCDLAEKSLMALNMDL